MNDGIVATALINFCIMLDKGQKHFWVVHLKLRAERIWRSTPSYRGQFQADCFRVKKIPNVKVLSEDIQEMTNAPGGGHIVTVEDPEGFPINFVHGQSVSEVAYKTPEKLMFNDETHKPRQRKFQRFEPGPAEVYKLGHFGLVVENFAVQMDWYTRYFNFVPSDILYLPVPQSTKGEPERKEVAMFAHIDRGEDMVDHHTLFLTSAVPGKKHHVHHCSFEVHDFDTQALGHQWLSQKNYNSVWGVGRHILGSQIFDYWWDTTGNMVEHYTDGDLVNIETPMAFGPAVHEGLAVWGPEVPAAFLD